MSAKKLGENKMKPIDGDKVFDILCRFCKYDKSQFCEALAKEIARLPELTIQDIKRGKQ